MFKKQFVVHPVSFFIILIKILKHQQMKKAVYTFLLVFVLFISKEVHTFNNQPPTGYTNAPGEANCSSCHGTALYNANTAQPPSIGFNLTTTVPLGAMQPNTTYLMSLTFSNPGSTKYGFQIVALPNNANQNSTSIGTLALNSGNSAVNVSTVLGRTYARTTSSGTSALSNTRTWNFNYTTPNNQTGVTFYAIVNSADGDNMASSDDSVWAKTFTASVLPVKWLSQSASIINNQVHVKWQTAAEINNKGFEIERSADGTLWHSVGEVKGNGNTSKVSSYVFVDKNTSSENGYYRIKQIDFDGAYEYGNVLAVNYAEGTDILYNASEKYIYTTGLVMPIKAAVYQLNGQLIEAEVGLNNKIKLDHLKPGIYVVRLTLPNQQVLVKKVLVQ